MEKRIGSTTGLVTKETFVFICWSEPGRWGGLHFDILLFGAVMRSGYSNHRSLTDDVTEEGW
jgi:hypothetical protein